MSGVTDQAVLSTLALAELHKQFRVPIWFGGLRHLWSSLCATFGQCDSVSATVELKKGKVLRARQRQLSAGVVGDYVIRFVDGEYVARRGRKFYDRRLHRPRQPSPFPAVERQLCGSTLYPQYIRQNHMYSVNSEKTSNLAEAKRWVTRQAAHKANSKLFGRVIRASTIAIATSSTLALGEGVTGSRVSPEAGVILIDPPSEDASAVEL